MQECLNSLAVFAGPLSFSQHRVEMDVDRCSRFPAVVGKMFPARMSPMVSQKLMNILTSNTSQFSKAHTDLMDCGTRSLLVAPLVGEVAIILVLIVDVLHQLVCKSVVLVGS